MRPLLLGQVKRSCPSCGPSEPGGEEKKGRGNPVSVQLFPPELVSPWGGGGAKNKGTGGQDGWSRGCPLTPAFPVLPPPPGGAHHLIPPSQRCGRSRPDLPLLPPSVRRRGRVETHLSPAQSSPSRAGFRGPTLEESRHSELYTFPPDL